MNRRDRNHRHTALMLLACAFAFVYLLAWQFQGDDIVQQRDGIPPPELPTTLDRVINAQDQIDQTTTLVNSGASQLTQAQSTSASGTEISFTSLNALPQSFTRLGLISTQGIMMDQQGTIVTTNTNRIAWQGDRKTFAGEELQGLGIEADSLTFYNDPSWVNILVLIEVVRNDQSLLIQIPYASYRDDKVHLNSLIRQLTQK